MLENAFYTTSHLSIAKGGWARLRVAPERLLLWHSMREPVYKICPAAALQEARVSGHLEGSADDARDGFVHLSAGHQVVGTLAKYFAGHRDLVLLAVDPDRLGERLRWEPSRGGELFPHLYGPLELALPLQEDGSHRLPPGIAQ
jgi:uncharacterized protein (DUF952 family)